MGNRAHVIFANDDGSEISPAIYLHWNGGPESVYAYLAELDRRDVRADQCYEAARFVAIVSEHFDNEYYGGLSLGILEGPALIKPYALEPYNHGDNGVYVIVRGKETKVRRFVGHESLREMTAEEVETERKAALKHRYNVGEDTIASTFTKPTEREHFDRLANQRKSA